MNTPEMAKAESKEQPLLSLEEIQSRLSVLREIEGEQYGKGKDEDELISCIAKIREDFVEGLLKEKEGFSKVFETSNGSVYFQLSTGEVLRAKKMKDKEEFGTGNGDHFNMAPLMNDLFFITVEEAERTIGSREFPGEIIKTEDYAIGVCPFDINMLDFGSKIEFEKTERGILLKGTRWTKLEGENEIDTKGNLVGGIHTGHPIIKIIK